MSLKHAKREKAEAAVREDAVKRTEDSMEAAQAAADWP